jgi:hypothetical protein
MTRAKRAGTWFGLSRVQTGLHGLAMRLPLKLRSPELLRALVSVLKCLSESCERAGAAFITAVRLAWVFSAAAVEWGNTAANAWRSDISYARYLSTHMILKGLRS